MEAVERTQEGSWLSLVAETAGVAGAGVARIELICPDCAPGFVTAVVQLLGPYGQVLAATRWVGRGSELSRGVKIDLAYDLESSDDIHLIGWQQRTALQGSPSAALAPETPTVVRFHPTRFHPTRAMKLMLRSPVSAPRLRSALPGRDQEVAA